MRNTIFFGMSCMLAGTSAFAGTDDQSFFAILVETRVGRLAGMPPMDLSKLPPGIKLPPQALMFSGTPARSIDIRLWSPGIAPKDAKAWVVPPAGLKKGNKLDLNLFRPEPGKTSNKIGGIDPNSDPEKFTIKMYWGSSATVKEGQPKIIKWDGLDADQKAALEKASAQGQNTGSYFYKADWTTGYYPNPRDPGLIDSDASLVGKYVLNSTYTGNIEIEAPSGLDFMEGINLTSPKLDSKLDLNKAIALEWGQVPNSLGFSGMAMGMEGKNTLILWSASEVYDPTGMGDSGYMQMAEVRDRVAKTIFMAGDRTSVTIPAGIFANADVAMLMMTGYGPGAALESGKPLPRIQTKTSLMVMLGGKKTPF